MEYCSITIHIQLQRPIGYNILTHYHDINILYKFSCCHACCTVATIDDIQWPAWGAYFIRNSSDMLSLELVDSTEVPELLAARLGLALTVLHREASWPIRCDITSTNVINDLGPAPLQPSVAICPVNCTSLLTMKLLSSRCSQFHVELYLELRSHDIFRLFIGNFRSHFSTLWYVCVMNKQCNVQKYIVCT